MKIEFSKDEIHTLYIAMAAHYVAEHEKKIEGERPSERAMRVSEVGALFERVKQYRHGVKS